MVNGTEIIDEIHKVQSELNQCLRELSELPPLDDHNGDNRRKTIEGITEKMVDIYSRKIGDVEFRHQYSDFLNFIIDELGPDNLDVMIQNLTDLINHYVEKGWPDAKILMKLLKLRDHLELDIQRSAIIQEEKGIANEIKEYRSKVNDYETKIEELNRKTEELNSSFKSYPVQTVTVLGIFSAIVLAFTGGLNFLSGSFSEIATADPIKVILIVLVCGFILYNVILLLLFTILKILNINEVSRKHKLWDPCIVFNAIILVLMVTVSIWGVHCGIFN